MRKGKREMQRENLDTPVEAEQQDYTFVPETSAYTIRPTEGRHQLTARDLAVNRQARALFNVATPGLPIDADAPQLRPLTEPFANAIEKVLQQLHISESPFLEHVRKQWNTILPPEITTFTKPAKWERGTLFVHVNSATKLFELRQHAHKTIEAAVRRIAGDIQVRHVELRVGT
jgi:hypothetical protein